MTIALSTAQQTVVDSRGEHLQVIACAGSGKTEAVSRRVAGLVADGEAIGWTVGTRSLTDR